MSIRKFYTNYLLPAAVFQGVIIGGGYATGREIVEFITVNGPIGGLLSTLIIAIGFSIVLSLSFAFAKNFGLSDYRSFLIELLGRWWIFYEILFLLLLILVIAIVTAAATDTAKAALNLPDSITILAICTLIVFCNYLGKGFIQKLLVLWTILLMTSLVLYTFSCLSYLETASVFSQTSELDFSTSSLSGFKFAVYNSALVPVLIYCTTQIENPKTAFKAGIFAGIIGALPALLLHLSFLTRYPAITQQTVPTFWLLENLGYAKFEVLYLTILFGTIVLTAVGLLHGVNERINGWLTQYDRMSLRPRAKALISSVILLSSIISSKIGIIALVAKGYGLIAWGFFCVFTLPLVTIGLRKLIIRSSKNET